MEDFVKRDTWLCWQCADAVDAEEAVWDAGVAWHVGCAPNQPDEECLEGKHEVGLLVSLMAPKGRDYFFFCWDCERRF